MAKSKKYPSSSESSSPPSQPSKRDYTGKGLSALNERLPLCGWLSKKPVGYSGLPAFFFTFPLYRSLLPPVTEVTLPSAISAFVFPPPVPLLKIAPRVGVLPDAGDDSEIFGMDDFAVDDEG